MALMLRCIEQNIFQDISKLRGPKKMEKGRSFLIWKGNIYR